MQKRERDRRLEQAHLPLLSYSTEESRVQRRLLLAFFSRPCKAMCPRSLPRLLAGAPWLRAAWLVLWRNRGTINHNIRHLIITKYLQRLAFHDETSTLIEERICARKQFWKIAKTKDLMKCIRFETRLLTMETGDLLIAHNENITRGHRLSHRLTPCFHQGVWARVKNPRNSELFLLDDVEGLLPPDED